jgi:hypothetical protein
MSKNRLTLQEPSERSQFLTRGSLFKNHVAKVYVFDRIRHGTAQEILSRASVACRFESPHTAVSEHQWREYFRIARNVVKCSSKLLRIKCTGA